MAAECDEFASGQWAESVVDVSFVQLERLVGGTGGVVEELAPARFRDLVRGAMKDEDRRHAFWNAADRYLERQDITRYTRYSVAPTCKINASRACGAHS
jgi:hypothetical protein